MRYARLEYLQCLLVIKTICANTVWLVFHRHYLILDKERKYKKEKYINLETVYLETYSESSRTPAMEFFGEIC